RFEQRPAETLAVGELLDREVELTDGSGRVRIVAVAIEQHRSRDWYVTAPAVMRPAQGRVMRRRGETMTADVGAVRALAPHTAQAADLMLATYEDLKPADLAEVLHELSDTRRLEVAAALADERL